MRRDSVMEFLSPFCASVSRFYSTEHWLSPAPINEREVTLTGRSEVWRARSFN